jgi:hypothetical protein
VRRDISSADSCCSFLFPFSCAAASGSTQAWQKKKTTAQTRSTKKKQPEKKDTLHWSKTLALSLFSLSRSPRKKKSD